MIKPSELAGRKNLASGRVAAAARLEKAIDAGLKEAPIDAGKYNIVLPGRDVFDDPGLVRIIQDRYGPHWRVVVVGPVEVGGDPTRPGTLLYFFPQE